MCPGSLWLCPQPCIPQLWNSTAPCQAGWSKWSVRSSNRAGFCSGAPCLSLELSFSSLFLGSSLLPLLLVFPPGREEEKSSTRGEGDKMDAPLLLFLCLPPALQHQDADAKRVTSLSLMIFFYYYFSLFQRGSGPRGEGQVWGALQQREWEGQGVVCEIRERPGKESWGEAAGILRGLHNSLRPGGFIYIPKKYFWKAGTQRKQGTTAEGDTGANKYILSS